MPGSAVVDFAITTQNAPGRPKWLSRDPLGEAGGLNLYGFVDNDPVNNADYLGMVLINTGGGLMPTETLATLEDLFPVEIPVTFADFSPGLAGIIPPSSESAAPPEALMQPLLDELNALISKEIGWHFVDQFDARDINIRTTRTPEENDRYYSAKSDWSLVIANNFETIFNTAFAKSRVPDTYKAQIYWLAWPAPTPRRGRMRRDPSPSGAGERM